MAKSFLVGVLAQKFMHRKPPGLDPGLLGKLVFGLRQI